MVGKQSFDCKLDRALDHLGALQSACERFFEGRPCGVIGQCDIATHEHLIYFDSWQSPPAEIATLAADCFHNLRQALDHIAYRLAVSISGRDPPPNESGIYFLIADSPQKFEGKLASSFGSPKRIPADIRAVLERVQPYNGGHFPVLAVLDDLDNFDKHRFPPIMAVGGLVPSFTIGQLTVSSIVGPRVGPVKPGTEILRFTPVPDSPMDMNFPTTHFVAFGEGKPGQGHDVLNVLIEARIVIRTEIAEPLGAYL